MFTAVRRITLNTLAVTLLATSGGALASESKSAGPGAHWTYSGAEGPANWGKLSTAYATCGTGQQQSPINIEHTQQAGLSDIAVDYRAGALSIVNNGHTIQVNVTPGSTMSIGHTNYQLLQFHFHTPSENVVKGKSFPMEVHFVHKDKEGHLGVLAVFFKQGEANAALGEIWGKMPASADGVHAHKEVVVNGRDLLPNNMDYYRFVGSLTTPPCSEGVQWHVAKTPVEASAEQISRFTSLIGANARPVQQLGHRLLIDSAQSAGSAH